MLKKINWQVFVEGLCTATYSVILSYLVISEKYQSFVVPSTKPYLIFSIIVSFIWFIFSLSKLFKPRNRTRSVHTLVLAVPLLFVLMPFNISAEDLLTDSNRKSADAGIIETDNSSSDDTLNNNSNTDTGVKGYEPASLYEDLQGLDEENKHIDMVEEEFYQWVLEIYANIDKYDGYTISMTGFVLKDPDSMADNEFIPARLVMTCCAADLSAVGLYCKYDNTNELQNDEWVTVKGTLVKGEYNGYAEPQVIVSEITPAQKSEAEFLYPY